MVFEELLRLLQAEMNRAVRTRQGAESPGVRPSYVVRDLVVVVLVRIARADAALADGVVLLGAAHAAPPRRGRSSPIPACSTWSASMHAG